MTSQKFCAQFMINYMHFGRYSLINAEESHYTWNMTIHLVSLGHINRMTPLNKLLIDVVNEI